MPKSLLGALTLIALVPFSAVGLVIAMFHAGCIWVDRVFDKWLTKAEEAERGAE